MSTINDIAKSSLPSAIPSFTLRSLTLFAVENQSRVWKFDDLLAVTAFDPSLL